MTTATAITLDRDIVERFLVEVDALAMFDARLNAPNETWLQQRLYGAIEEFEQAAFGSPGEDAGLHERAYVRVEELWREFVANFERSDVTGANDGVV